MINFDVTRSYYEDLKRFSFVHAAKLIIRKINEWKKSFIKES